MLRALTLSLASLLLLSCALSQPERGQPWESRVQLPPLLMTQRRGEDTRGSVLWPFIHWRNEGTEFEAGIRPLIRWERNIPENSFQLDLLWPLIRWDRSGQQLDWRFFPLFGGWELNRQAGDPERYFVLFPLMWFQREPNRYSAWIGPFGRIRESDQAGTLSFTALLPFWRSVDGRSGETSTSLFPFIWGTRQGELIYSVLFPIYWDIDFSAGEHFWGIIPLWGQYEDVSQGGVVRNKTTLFFPPLYINQMRDRGQRMSHHVLWPLIAFGRGPGERLIRLWPLFSSQTAPLTQPESHRHDLFVFPVLVASYYEEGEVFGRRITGPLFWHWWGPDFGDRIRRTWGLYPLFNAHVTEGVGSGFHVFDPLFFWEGRVAHERLAMLWTFFRHEETADGQFSETSLLWRLFHHVREGESTRMAIFPFITIEQSPDRSRTAFLWRFFENTVEPDGRYLRLLFSPRFRIGQGTAAASESRD